MEKAASGLQTAMLFAPRLLGFHASHEGARWAAAQTCPGNIVPRTPFP